MILQHPAIKRLRFLGYAEAFSWLLLLVAMSLKYIWNKPLMVTYTGWVHGILFILYCIHLLFAQRILNWPFKKLLIGCAAAFLPFGTLWFDKRIKEV
jgi:integral membrane protein